MVLELLDNFEASAVGPDDLNDSNSGTKLEIPTLSNCLASLDKEAKALARDDNEDVVPISEPCRIAEKEGKEAWLISNYKKFLKWSFWDILQRGLMVFATIVTTIFLREVRVDQNSWKRWSLKRIPFLRLLSMSLAPALVGVFALSSAFVFQLFWDANFDLTQRQLTTLFQNNWVYFTWHFMPCMTLSIACLILMDKHDDWVAEASLLIGVVSAGILIGMFWLVTITFTPAPEDLVTKLPLPWGGDWPIKSDILRDTIITSALPAIFIIFFAAFLELTEESRGLNWLSVRLLVFLLTTLRKLLGPRFGKAVAAIGPVAIAVLAGSYYAGDPALAETQTSALGFSAVETVDGDASASKAGQKILRIGVRSDARPFSYQSQSYLDVLTAATRGPLAQEYYTGFMIKICDAVLADLLLSPLPTGTEGSMMRLTHSDIEVIDVDELIRENPKTSRIDYFGTEFDILCDPSTITNDRRDGLILSPPLFLSGISFIDLPGLPKPKQESDQCPDRPLIGLVGNTTAASMGIRAILEAEELPLYRKLLIDWLDDQKNNCKSKEVYEAVKIFGSHSEASQAFCNEEFYYYLGDQEIIDHNARKIPSCEFDQSARTFTIDRYAIYGKIDYTNRERALWTARFFEALSQKVSFSPSILDTAFSDSFVGVEKSRALELFFWSIRGPK